MSYPIQDFGVNGAFPATVGGTGATVKYFGRNQASAAGATWTSPATPSSTSAVGALWVPGDNKLNGQWMTVSASGDFTPASNATSETVEIAIYAVTGSLAAPVYTKLATTGAYAPGIDGIAYNFAVRANLLGDTNSGIVGGTQFALVNNTLQTATAALTNSLTGINFASGNASLYQGAPFGLVVGITFGASNAANKANLYQFSIEA